MTQNTPRKPSRSEKLKPIELVGFSGVMALFLGLVVLMSTRDVVLALIGFGGTFILVLAVIALLMLGMKPNPAKRSDLEE
ncbi:ABC transporter ATP-binding protein [Cryobacterium cheniae]|uniref:ABC transporter ATP-binding protein n=1 Tax=Cryobacterium cheniae TaxID=1259262 RepID=A0A4R8XM77_9MICO|nr:ABC transporter ATP-binding protein [Cryobacterium cheniae]TFC78703.1 ABC transporter ATP-binding protein [Cryobacterium cheniae]